MCVTHLPQLAAFGDQHFRVEKDLREGRTLTNVQKLDFGRRTLELAQMLGGNTEANQNAAVETLEQARQKKSSQTNL